MAMRPPRGRARGGVLRLVREFATPAGVSAKRAGSPAAPEVHPSYSRLRSAVTAPVGVRRKIHNMATVGRVRVWWQEFCPGDRGVNALTSQRLTDGGNGRTFADVRVEVRPA